MSNRNLNMRNNQHFFDVFLGDLLGEASFSESLKKSFQSEAKIKVNILETESVYEVEASLPGFDRDEINIDFNEDVLTISAQKNEENQKGNNEKNWLAKEISTSSISRKFTFSSHVDSENIKGKYENGLVRLTLPKSISQNNRKIDLE